MVVSLKIVELCGVLMVYLNTLMSTAAEMMDGNVMLDINRDPPFPPLIIKSLRLFSVGLEKAMVNNTKLKDLFELAMACIRKC